MPSKQPFRTTRRILKLASLGLAGLIAGLLSGCSASPDSTPIRIAGNWHFSSLNSQNIRSSKSSGTQDVPALRRAPSARRLDYGCYHPNHPTIPTTHTVSMTTMTTPGT
jgi:hypothetical protein